MRKRIIALVLLVALVVGWLPASSVFGIGKEVEAASEETTETTGRSLGDGSFKVGNTFSFPSDGGMVVSVYPYYRNRVGFYVDFESWPSHSTMGALGPFNGSFSSAMGTTTIPFGNKGGQEHILSVSAEPYAGYQITGWWVGNYNQVSLPTSKYQFTLTQAQVAAMYGQPAALSTAIMCYAEPIQYSITYNLNGGTVSGNPSSYNIEGSFTLNNPTREGYTFLGWEGTDLSGRTTNVTVPAGSMGNRTYTAVWQQNAEEEYMIGYVLNGGVDPDNPTSYTKSSATFTLKNPTKNGYVFTGWTSYESSTPQLTVTIPQGSTGHRIYIANWEEAVVDYTITYNLNGGSDPGNPVKYNKNTETFTLNNPTRSGYLFTGWTGSNGTTPQTTVTINQGSTGNRTYTANWAEIVTNYNITYDLDGGKDPGNPVTYNKNTETFTLKNPTKEGYTFTGWTGSNGDTPQTTVTIGKGSTGDKHYVAHWERNKVEMCPFILDLSKEILTDKNGNQIGGITITGSEITVNIPKAYFADLGCTIDHTHLVRVIGTTSKTVTMNGEYHTRIEGVTASKFVMKATGEVTFTGTNLFTADKGTVLDFSSGVTGINIANGVTVVVAAKDSTNTLTSGAETKAKELDLTMYETSSEALSLKIADRVITVPKDMGRVAVMDGLSGSWLTGDIKVTSSDGKSYVRGASNGGDKYELSDYSDQNHYGNTFPLGLQGNANLGRYYAVRLPKKTKQLDVALSTKIVFNIYTSKTGEEGFEAEDSTLDNQSYICEDEIDIQTDHIQFGKETAPVDVSYGGVIVKDNKASDYVLRAFGAVDENTMKESVDKPIVCLDMVINNGTDETAFPLDEQNKNTTDAAATIAPGAGNKLQIRRPSDYTSDTVKRYYQIPRLLTEEGYNMLRGHHAVSLVFTLN